MLSSVLYMLMATPRTFKLVDLPFGGSPPPSGLNVMVSLPLPLITGIGGLVLVAKRVAANAIGWVQPGTSRGTFFMMMGSRKTVPPDDVAERTVGTAPHLFEVKLLHALFVGRDGGALDAHAVLLDGLRLRRP